MAWRQPGWNSDSQWLAYTGSDGKLIWIMRPDGSDARSLVADGETNRFPWFLPDGRLAFITEYVPPRFDTAFTDAWAHWSQVKLFASLSRANSRGFRH